MSEATKLRRLRTSNSTLMKGNLALLMAIREVDAEIHEEWGVLQQLCETLERNGQGIPPKCLALMGGDSERAAEGDTDNTSSGGSTVDKEKKENDFASTILNPVAEE